MEFSNKTLNSEFVKNTSTDLLSLENSPLEHSLLSNQSLQNEPGSDEAFLPDSFIHEYLTFEQWDAIADLYIPCLFSISVVRLIMQYKHDGKPLSSLGLWSFLAGICLVYMMMFIDKLLAIWPAMGGDFSTHTALSLWGVLYLAWNTRNRLVQIVSILSWLLYLILMKLQSYHSLFDMITTSILIIPLACVILYMSERKVRSQQR